MRYFIISVNGIRALMSSTVDAYKLIGEMPPESPTDAFLQALEEIGLLLEVEYAGNMELPTDGNPGTGGSSNGVH